MKSSKRTFLAMATAAALAATTFSGMAQAWEPTKPIDFVIMAGAGGGAAGRVHARRAEWARPSSRNERTFTLLQATRGRDPYSVIGEFGGEYWK